MPWMPSPELAEKLVIEYLIDELHARFHFLDSSEKEVLQRRISRVKELDVIIGKSKEKLAMNQ